MENRFDLTIEMVADEFRVSEQTIRRMIDDGRLPAARVGVQWRLCRDHVNVAFKVPAPVPVLNKPEAPINDHNF